jgi:hypothetical protein
MSHSGGASADGFALGAVARVVAGDVVGRPALVVTGAALAETAGCDAFSTGACGAEALAAGATATARLAAGGVAADATTTGALDRSVGSAAGSRVRTNTSAPIPTLRPMTSATSGATKRPRDAVLADAASVTAGA